VACFKKKRKKTELPIKKKDEEPKFVSWGLRSQESTATIHLEKGEVLGGEEGGRETSEEKKRRKLGAFWSDLNKKKKPLFSQLRLKSV